MSEVIDLIARAHNLLNAENLCDGCAVRLIELEQRLNSGNLTVAVIGQFKRGKSTFLNKVIGEEILPVGIIPVTTAVTKISQGEKSSSVNFIDGDSRRVDSNELTNFLAESSNSDNHLGVASVEIKVPNPMFGQGIIFVDTPGVGSVHKHNTKAAYDFVRDSDAVIFMLSVDSPLNEIELNFLKEAKEYAAKIYFAINKIDLVSEQDLKTYVEYCNNILSNTLESGVQIYPISAKSVEGVGQLIAKITNDCTSESSCLLEKSISSKTCETIDIAISQLDIIISAIKMPIERIEQIQSELEKCLNKLTKMSKQSFLLLNQSSEEVIEDIQKNFNLLSSDLYSERESLLLELYHYNEKVSAKKLESLLSPIVDEALHEKLSEINQLKLESFKKAYESLTNQVSEQILEMQDYVAGSVQELFGVKYRFEKKEYALSNNNDSFYIAVNRSHSFYSLKFWDNPIFDHFVSRKFACKRVLNRVLSEMDSDIKRNLKSMISNYRYKLRESLRNFKFLFDSEASRLSKDLIETIEKAMDEKLSSKSDVEKRISDLNCLIVELQKIKSLLV